MTSKDDELYAIWDSEDAMQKKRDEEEEAAREYKERHQKEIENERLREAIETKRELEIYLQEEKKKRLKKRIHTLHLDEETGEYIYPESRAIDPETGEYI